MVPPAIVDIAGISEKSSSAHIGASGVSSALNNAVSDAGNRRAPSASVTEATANTRPNEPMIR